MTPLRAAIVGAVALGVALIGIGVAMLDDGDDGSSESAEKSASSTATRPTGPRAGGAPDGGGPDAVPLEQQAEVGRGVRNSDGADQTVVKRISRDKSVTFHIRLYNGGYERDGLTVEGTRATQEGYGLTYLDGPTKADITEQVLAGSYTTGPIPPGGYVTLNVVMSVPAAAPAGADQEAVLTVASTADPGRRDVAKFVSGPKN